MLVFPHPEQAKSSDDAEEGLLFMQEMIELSKLQQEQPENPPRVVSFTRWVDGHSSKVTIQAGPAQFGLDLKGDVQVTFFCIFITLILFHICNIPLFYWGWIGYFFPFPLEMNFTLCILCEAFLLIIPLTISSKGQRTCCKGQAFTCL